MDKTQTRTRAAAAIDAALQDQEPLDGATVLQLLDAAGIGLVEATGTVCLPVADARHLHDSMTINSTHDSALWYRLRELIAAAGRTAKKGSAG